MAEFRVAFWNLQNLFEPSVVDRGPKSEVELEERITLIAEVTRRFFSGNGPDLLGLAEVGSERIFEKLGEAIFGAGRFQGIWEPPGMSVGSNAQTGLGLLGRASLITGMRKVLVDRPLIAQRPRAVIVECDVQGVAESLLMIVTHWKSRRPGTAISDADDRRQSADWLGDFLSRRDRTTSTVVMGDFNAEPFETPFSELRLRAGRTFSRALWSNATPAYLYNTGWKFLTEPSHWEDAAKTGYVEPRPKSSHGETGVQLFDHVMVSGRLLKHGPFRLRESSVCFHCEIGVNARRTRDGVLHPLRWQEREVGSQEFIGCSDHFPVLACFDLV